jgi:hypothetical protein
MKIFLQISKIIKINRGHLLSSSHTIKEFQILIPENAESLWIVRKKDKRMSLSALIHVMDHIH